MRSSQWFDHLVLSFEVNAMKPDKKIYEVAISKAGDKAR
jgi:FMN phosphatase YigB (HAD superfamily)